MAEASGPRTESMFNVEHALASAYLLAEDTEHALEHYRKAAELGEALGLRNDKLVYSLTQSASILIDQDRLAEAEAPMRRGLELARQLGIEVELASALVAQGRWLLARGETAAARQPLAEALELRSRSNEPPRFRGSSRFLLARALWDADPRRALELAHAARVDLQDMLESTPPDARGAAHQRRVTQELMEDVDRWLAARNR
jgi:tetratricopeptide (TPR) repeat protein